MTQLIHPELSYEVRAVLLDVYNKLGPMLGGRQELTPQFAAT